MVIPGGRGGLGGTVSPQDRGVPGGRPPGLAELARDTLNRARDHVLGLQHADGWWQGELETNVTMDAEDLLLRQFLGVRDDATTAAAARWIRSQQRADGTWANFFGGPADLSTTVEAYVALRLAGDPADARHMAIARDWILAQGGVEATRVFTRIWLALSGLWSWDDLPVIPPELIYLPSWFPLNIYDWGCWARQTIVALAIVQSFRPSRPIGITIDELKTGRPHGRAPRPPRTPDARPLPAARPSTEAPTPTSTMIMASSMQIEPNSGHDHESALPPQPVRSAAPGGRLHSSLGGLRPPRPPWQPPPAREGFPPPRTPLGDPWAQAFNALDRLLHHYRPVKSVRRAALRRCAEWIITRQERDGCWGGIQPPWVYSLMALNLLGYDLEHPVMARGLAGLDRFTITEEGPEGPVRRLEACQSPVWDTVLTMIALADAGLPPDDPALRRAGRWVLGEEIRGPGDWQVRRPSLEPGGWAFEFDNDNYPDTDDTGEVVLALRRTDLPAVPAAIDRGLRWLAGMQSKDGGWGAFDADNTRALVNKLPFCDFGAVIDPPSADVTAHIVEAFALEGKTDHPALRRGVTWLLKAQEADGSWFGRWGANYIYGTGAVVPALIAAGVKPSKPCIRRAVAWLEAHQNPDGGWGEDLRSYDDQALAGQGTSTASQTAWALLALLAAGESDSRAVENGIRYLAVTQREDGNWDHALFTGTGFPGDFYLNYRMYRLAFPLSALGRFVRE
ncbi:MAG: squalene--hopene cyclase [Streptosporangiaceae bacterium]